MSFPDFTVPTCKLSPPRLDFSEIVKIMPDCLAAFPVGDVVEKFPGQFNHLVTGIQKVLVPRDSMKGVGFHSAETSGSLQLDSGGKRIKFSPRDLQEISKDFSIIITPCETLPVDGSAGSRREKRAAESSMNFLQNVPKNDKIIIASLPALKKPQHELLLAEKLLESSNGLYLANSESMQSIDLQKRVARVIDCMTAKSCLLVVPCKGRPSEVVQIVSKYKNALFETSYPFQLAEEGKLLYLRNSGESKFPGFDHPEIDLRDDRWFRDHRQLTLLFKDSHSIVQESAKHTVSYIHHLLKREELLGYQLLATLNLFTYAKLFSSMKDAIRDDQWNSWVETFTELNIESLEGIDVVDDKKPVKRRKLD